MQYRIAAVIAETPDATLLNYGFMDAGFFTATGIAPGVKYFHRTNMPLREMLDEQNRYIEEGICDYVITRGMLPESISERYELVAEADSPGNMLTFNVFLDSAEEVCRVFAKLKDGGTVLTELGPQFWTSVYGEVRDRYGIRWQVMTNA